MKPYLKLWLIRWWDDAVNGRAKPNRELERVGWICGITITERGVQALMQPDFCK